MLKSLNLPYHNPHHTLILSDSDPSCTRTLTLQLSTIISTLPPWSLSHRLWVDLTRLVTMTHGPTTFTLTILTLTLPLNSTSPRNFRSNQKSPDFLDKACLAKSWESWFLGEPLFAENAKVLIFWSPHFKRTSVLVFPLEIDVFSALVWIN